MDISLRKRSIDDAEQFWHILNNENFKWFGRPPKDVEGEKEYIKKEMQNPLLINYTILCDDYIVGGMGIKLNPHRQWIAEIGYFVDEKYWNRGIATEALLLCDVELADLSISRAELIIDPENFASRRAAEKSGYQLEGVCKGKIKLNGSFLPGCMYAKHMEIVYI